MIENLTVENYRSFENYSMNNLKRVNLLTGLNNSGKTSLLEAVEILASGGEPDRLFAISSRRNEFVLSAADEASSFGDPSHYFYNRNMNPLKVRIAIRSNIWRVFFQLDTTVGDRPYLLVNRKAKDSSETEQVRIKLTEHGGFDSSSIRAGWGSIPDDKGYCLVELLGINSNSQQIERLWDRLLISGQEAAPAESLRILDDRIDSVVMLVSGRPANRLFVGKSGEKSRTPLGSHGDGVRRLLEIAAGMCTVSGGILLVDEIDTGLHYSVLADMWKLVIGTAIKNDIQVFATTHSLDCLRGLHEACQANPEFAREISLQTIDRNLTQSIDTNAEGLAVSLAIGIEVR